MVPEEPPFLAKAWQGLRGAEREFAAGAYDNCVNRAYYACFQAAIAALVQAKIHSPGGKWHHAFVQAQFHGELLNKRKLYSSSLQGDLERLYDLRVTADYDEANVAHSEAEGTAPGAAFRGDNRDAGRCTAMTTRRRRPRRSEIDAALAELRQIILQKYPEATFEVKRGIDEPDSFELWATVDIEDGNDVIDLVLDRVLDMQLEDGLPIHVIPLRPADSKWERELRAAMAAANH